MTDHYPFTPPLELVHQWADMLASRSDQAVFTKAAKWGSDQELEACCTWLEKQHDKLGWAYRMHDRDLRTARR
jgi:hypothetical protein